MERVGKYYDLPAMGEAPAMTIQVSVVDSGLVWFKDVQSPFHGALKNDMFLEHAIVSTWPWRPMSQAKKDGTPYLLKLKDPIPAPYDIAKTYNWDAAKFKFKDGFIFVGLNYTDTWEVKPKTDSGWMFAAPVGQGGFPDDWFVGFMELPS